jgi:4-hydroxy-4-methyl-2-oxoglutarate aldolase
VIDAFRALGVATVHEASKLPSNVDPAIHPMWRGAVTCGPAFTVKCVPGDNLPIHLALAQVAPGDVLVVDAGGHIAGYWGMILTVSAQQRGVAGLVIDGGVRDTRDLEQLAFPVFARGIGVNGAVKQDAGSLGTPVTVGGVKIARGDLVLGDADGVVAIPAAEIDRVLAASREREERERSVVERLKRGELTADIYGFKRPT